MSTAIQRRRGTTAQHSSFAGLAGELTVDTDKKTVVVHDGTTAGGMPLLPKTMSDGTANGVLYLNGSKVATAGTALTFDGTNLGVGSGGVSAGLLRVWSGSNDKRIQLSNDGTVSIINSTYGSSGASPLVFKISDDEQMRLTSTGLGIGTSSPGAKLDVAEVNFANIARFSRNITGTNSIGSAVRVRTSTTGDMVDGFGTAIVFAIEDNAAVQNDVASINAIRTGADNTGALTFSTTSAGSSTEKLRIDSSGNLGLGVTPSAWGSSWKALQVGGGSLWANPSSASNTLHLTRNAYYDGTSYKYIATGTASNYDQDSGSHLWFTAPSGTAGNAISFTQAMTLDASGNLGLGMTSPVGRLTIQGAAGTNGINQGIGFLYSNGTQYGAIGLNNSSGWLQIMGRAAAGLTFHVNSDLQTTGEAMRIDSSGNLLVGTTSAGTGAIVDVQSTTKGVRFPNMTTTQKNAITPAAGTVVFDTTLAKLCVYSGSAWQTITSV